MIQGNDKQLKIGELPNLKIVPISEIIFHEDPDDERSTKLIEDIRKENRLKNPPVVATHSGTKKYILLDGANRLTALQSLNIPDVLVQHIDLFDPGLIFLHWHHAVEKFTKDNFLEIINNMYMYFLCLLKSGGAVLLHIAFVWSSRVSVKVAR